MSWLSSESYFLPFAGAAAAISIFETVIESPFISPDSLTL